MEQLYQNLFGLRFFAREVKPAGLPIYLTAGRTFLRMSYYDISFLLVCIPPDEQFGVVSLEKQLVLLSSRWKSKVAFRFETLSKAQRDSLIERNIPFISDTGQIYLPFLGVSLTNRFPRIKRAYSEKMMPITQCLFLYLLYNQKANPIIKTEAARRLEVSPMSITRACDQLAAMGLVCQMSRGKEHYVSITGNGVPMYERAKPFLINPIQKTIVTLANEEIQSFVLSGESALAKKTMLIDPKLPSRAVSKTWGANRYIPELDVRWSPEANAVQLELWKYDPALFAKDGVVDPISLALCFEENADERIEQAIEDYLGGYAW